MVLDLLTSPDDFFARRADDPGYLGPVLVVLAVAVVNVLGTLPVLQATLDAFPPGIGGIAVFVQALSAVIAMLVTVVRWLLYAGVFYAVAKVAYDGSGSFGATAALTGWGFVPALLAAAVNAVASFYVYRRVEFPDVNDPAAVQRFATQLQTDPILLTASALGVAFLLWSAFLWTFAVKNGHGLSLRAAAITVAVPTVFGLLFRLWSVFGGGVF